MRVASGYSLIEVLLAGVLLLMVSIFATNAILQANNTLLRAGQYTRAVLLVEQDVALARAQAVANGDLALGTYGVTTTPSTMLTALPTTDGKYTHTVQVTQNGATSKKIAAIVDWDDRNRHEQVVLVTYIFFPTSTSSTPL